MSGVFSLLKSQDSNEGFLLIFLIFSGALGFGLLVLAIRNVSRIIKNQTTMGEDNAPTNPEGQENNFRRIFCDSAFSWLLPTFPKINGFTWSGLANPPPCEDSSEECNS